MRRALASVVLVGLTAAGCSGEGARPGPSPDRATPPTPSATPEATPAGEGAERFERELRRTLTVPPMPAFTIPTELLSTAQNQSISGRLDVAPGLYQGIGVLDARCTESGGAAADTGATVTTGSRHYEEGTVRITVAGDGTGVYDDAGLHVAVLAGGAGVYDDGETRSSVAADGSGTWSRGDVRYTVRADGSGSYSDGSTRVWVEPGGAGGYEDATMRLSVRADGQVFGDGDPDRVAAVQTVLADGLPLFAPVAPVRLVEPSGTVCGTVIRLDANVLFDVDRAEVRPDGQDYLRRVADLLVALGSPAAQVNGHTDSVGDEAYNLDLSQRRAEEVRRLLVGSGVSGDSLRTQGLGETQPVQAETGADGAPDPAARQLNRRVEIVLLDR
ncbi:OmpA family protein [Cellulomonas aerilata]|uniref:OmpA-like domain-containing protein n=1 Tax=Cellulomonas aerilata TaxID=515326 RepID=A0A512DEQ1_9CELL|nr:OmpA family protein [Cellulomonas aerilata]GEO34941.1 hypothetical protein CAE01nite_26660 [Cellulomonas aerilata]